MSNAKDAFIAGFGPHMVPVTKPKAPHAPTIQAKDMGKCPGVLGIDGLWSPKAISKCECKTEAEADKWDGWGANVGIALGREANLIAFDNDADDPVVAAIINASIRSVLGDDTPCRTVDDPKSYRSLFPLRLTGGMVSGTTLTFTKDGKITKIDILADGKMFVSWGTNSRTMKPIQWNVDLFGYMDGVYDFPERPVEVVSEIVEKITVELGSEGWVRISGSVSAATAVSAAATTQRRAATEDEVNRWLVLIPNTDTDMQFDDRNAWVGMAHAIHGAASGAEWGRETWLRWCDQRTQNPGEPEKVYDSIKGESRVGLDFIREKARERNAALAAQLDFEFAPPIDDDYLTSLGSAAKWPALLKRYVWVTKEAVYYDMFTRLEITRTGLDMALGKFNAELCAEMGIKYKGQTFSTLFSMHPDTRIAETLAYWPGAPALISAGPRMCVNKWRRAEFNYRPNVTASDIQRWLDIVEFVYGKTEVERVIKYFALIVKLPEEKPNFALVAITVPGKGKDTTLVPVLHGVGEDNCRTVTADNLASRFNPFLESRLVHMPEMRQHQRGEKSSHDVANDLKAYLADKPEWVSLNNKNKAEYPIRNLTAWVFFSNESIPAFIGEGDRRMWIIHNTDPSKLPSDRYKDINDWFGKGGKDLVASYLRDYPLTAADVAFFKGTAPQSAAKSAIQAASRDPVLVALEEIIEEAREGSLFSVCLATADEVGAVLKERGLYAHRGRLSAMLRDLGARPISADERGNPKLVRIPGQLSRRLWALADTDAQGRDYTKLTTLAAGKLYSDKKWPVTAQTASIHQLKTGTDDDEI